MRITKIEPIALRLPEVDENRADGTQDAFLVRVHSDTGLTGIGEADTPPSLGRAMVEMPSSHALARGVRELLVGRDPYDIEAIWADLVHGTRWYGQSGFAIQVLSAIDMALHDLVGKALGIPVSQLLGGRRRESVRVYASALMPATPDEARREVSALRERGYTAVKLGWGPLGVDDDRDVALVRAARDACGSGCDLMIDAGQPWDWRHALRMARRFEELDLRWLEEPLKPDDVRGFAALTALSPVPIATGEQECTVAAFARLAIEGGVDILQPDMARCGLTQGRRLRTFVDETHVQLVPHAFSTGVLVAASLHIAATLRSDLCEYTVSDTPLARDLLATPFAVDSDGRVAVPTAPGLGVELDWDVVDRYRIPESS